MEEEKPVWAQYEERLRRVSTYIHDHLDDTLDMDRMAEIACLSPWHWHRIYRAVHGETAIATVKRLRLHRAAGELALTRQSISQIAKHAGYPNIGSFTRTFRDAYGQSPADYRNTGGHAPYQRATAQGIIAMFNVEIRTIEPMRLIGLPHTGPYMEINSAYTQIWQLLMTRQIFRPGMVSVAIYFDDPDVTPPESLRSFAAVSAPADVKADPPLTERGLDGGDHAVLLYKGPYAGLYAAYQWLFKTWLPGSGRAVGATPAYEVYLNNPSDTPPADLLTEIRLPIGKA
jgi:AraC family transcriptional regulator